MSLCFMKDVERAEMSSPDPGLVEGEVSQSPRVAVLPGPGAPLSVTGEGAAGKGRGGAGAEPIDLRWRWLSREPPVFPRRFEASPPLPGLRSPLALHLARVP